MATTADKTVATDAAFSYYAAALSENIGRTDEDYLICKDAVIGRTGKMQYSASQLRREQLQDLGLGSRYQPHDVVDLWRDPEEVFSPQSLASYESKPVTDNHPSTFVNAKNNRTHQRGHVRNVRAGTTPLASGDFPILADVIITDETLAKDVLSGRRRELSCGYTYHLAYDGTRLSQVGITGNHVAVVQRGRAGAEARINDAAPRKDIIVTKDTLISLGLSALAKDNADPSAIAAAARAAFATDVASQNEVNKSAIEAKDAEITTLRSELKKAEDALKARDEEDKKKDDDKKDDEDEKKKKSESEDADLAARLDAIDEKDDDDDDEDEDDDDEDEDGKKKKKAKSEDADFLEPIGDPVAERRAELRAMRPMVARSKDAALRKRFNRMVQEANDGLKGGTGADSYAQAHRAAGATTESNDTAMQTAVARMNERAQKAYEGVK